MHKPVLAAAVLLLCGCTLGPDFKSPSWASPETWFSQPAKPVASTPVAEPIDPNWWSLFHDNELTTLEDHVATENLDVRVATIRLAESRAQLGITAADASEAENRLLWSVAPADLAKTVLVKDHADVSPAPPPAGDAPAAKESAGQADAMAVAAPDSPPSQ